MLLLLVNVYECLVLFTDQILSVIDWWNPRRKEEHKWERWETRALFGYHWGWIHFLNSFFVSQILIHFLYPTNFMFDIIFRYSFCFFFFTLYFSIKNSSQLRESVCFLTGQVSVMGPIDLIFFFLYENVTIFIVKKMKTSKNCIQFLYSNSIFLDTENEIWIQIQS